MSDGGPRAVGPDAPAPGERFRGLIDALAAAPVVAIARGLTPDELVPVAEAALDAGIRVIEVTMDSPAAATAIEAVRDLGARGGVCVGAGTVVTEAALAAALGAGASFCVAPHLDLGLLAASATAGVPFVPGVVTPTEVSAAVEGGAQVVKLFPAGPLGPGWVRALRGPYPGLRVMATGGISPSAVGEWLAAGATAVGLGSELLAGGADRTEVARRCRAALAAASAGRDDRPAG